MTLRTYYVMLLVESVQFFLLLLRKLTFVNLFSKVWYLLKKMLINLLFLINIMDKSQHNEFVMCFYFQGNTVRRVGERGDGDISARDEPRGIQARRRAPRVLQLEQLVAVEAAAAERLPVARHAAGRGGQHDARAHRAHCSEERGGAGQRPPASGRRGRG